MGGYQPLADLPQLCFSFSLLLGTFSGDILVLIIPPPQKKEEAEKKSYSPGVGESLQRKSFMALQHDQLQHMPSERLHDVDDLSIDHTICSS